MTTDPQWVVVVRKDRQGPVVYSTGYLTKVDADAAAREFERQVRQVGGRDRKFEVRRENYAERVEREQLRSLQPGDPQ